MGVCCQSIKSSSSSRAHENFDKPEKNTANPQTKSEQDQQQEKQANPPIIVKSENIIVANSIKSAQNEEGNIKEMPKNEEKENQNARHISDQQKEPENKPDLVIKPSDQSNFNIIKESNGFNQGTYQRDSNINQFNDNEAINNEFTIFDNRKSFHEMNRLSLQKGLSDQDKNRQSMSRGSERKKQYILTENSENVDNNLVYLQEKKLFDLRNEFLERKAVKIYFSLFLEKKFLYDDDNSYTKIKGISKEIEDLTQRLFELHNIKYIEINEDTDHALEKYKIECKALAERDLDYFLPLFFFEFSLYPITFVKNAKLKKIYFSNSLRFVGKEVNEKRWAIPCFERLSIYYFCGERNIEMIKKNMHNEMYKYVYSVDDHKYLYEENWESLNANGFKYGCPDSAKDYSKNGFLNFISTQGEDEDKAEVFSYMFNNPTEAFESNSILWKKVSSHLNFLEKFDPRGAGGEQFWVVLRDLRKNLENYFNQNY
jgi:hypothetical protein